MMKLIKIAMFLEIFLKPRIIPDFILSLQTIRDWSFLLRRIFWNLFFEQTKQNIQDI